jgi:L-ascorbate metabolism protein UlaG (beta-lactamase superfamily)
MELDFKGGNCVVISSKKDTFVTDPNLSAVGLKDQGANATAILLTQPIFKVKADEDTLVIDGPGEYEVKNCSIRGIAAKRHSELDESTKAAIYRLDLEDVSVVVLGHVAPTLDDAQLEAIGIVDVLVLPVGGSGYTLDAKSAVDLVRKIEPKVVVPTHYAQDGINYEVPQQPVDDFIKELGAPVEELPKLKVKAGSLPAGLTVYKLALSK